MPVVKGREYRDMTIRAAEDAPDDEAKIVTGYASTFEQPYTLYEGDGWIYKEVVDRSAFDETDMTDVIMQYDHNGRVFARTKNGTLEVTPDETGLHIRADLGGTELGRELYDEIRGGYTDKMSFGFTVTGETEESDKADDGIRIITRRITQVGKLYDVSAVSIPANDSTSIEADATRRSIGELCDGVIARIEQEVLEAERIEEERRKATAKVKALLGGAND